MTPISASRFLMNTAQRPNLVMVRGEGSYLYDDSGKRYLDFVQGWAVNSLGHCPVEMVDALTVQARTLISPSPAFYNEPQLQLAERLCSLTGFNVVFFLSSGAEANEGALKLARKWGRLHKNGAYEIITTENAFHGRTLATMAASGKPGWDQLFPPNLPGFRKVPFGDTGAMEAAITDNTVALMVEPIQGEAGVIVPPAGYLKSLRSLCDTHNLLLICDEVQTGVGRTGTFLAAEQEGISADITTLGKGLGGGVPVSAMLAKDRANCFAPGDQGGTYAGNPLTAAVALAVVSAVSDPAFLQHVNTAASHLTGVLSQLAQDLGGASSVRGKGLLQAIILPDDRSAAVADKARDLGLLINAPRPNMLRFMPQLRVSAAEIDEMTSLLRRALADA
ncbi:MAG TPA: acetylornithine transaminase [Polyangiaceae bacterium]|nr:acetylornithine transaminase [Polyangiaceae bacterium]